MTPRGLLKIIPEAGRRKFGEQRMQNKSSSSYVLVEPLRFQSSSHRKGASPRFFAESDSHLLLRSSCLYVHRQCFQSLLSSLRQPHSRSDVVGRRRETAERGDRVSHSPGRHTTWERSFVSRL